MKRNLRPLHIQYHPYKWPMEIRADVLKWPDMVFHDYCKKCDQWFSDNQIHRCPEKSVGQFVAQDRPEVGFGHPGATPSTDRPSYANSDAQTVKDGG